MAEVTFVAFVNALADDSSIGGSERIPMVDGSTGKRVDISALVTYVNAQQAAATVQTPATGDELHGDRSGTQSVFTLDAVSDYAIERAWDQASDGSGLQATDQFLVERSGSVYEVTGTEVATFANNAVLDLTSLTAATPGASDLILFGSGSNPRKITLANFEAQLWSDFATYVDGLAENTAVTGSDKLYSLQGGTPKRLDPDTLAAYLNVAPGDVMAPVTQTPNNIPQWSSTADTLTDGLSLVTTVRTIAGGASDTALATEQGIREAIGDITSLDIDGATDIGAALVDADLFIVDDGAGGTNRKSAFSRVWTYIVTKLQALTGKTTPVDADILTIQDSADSNNLKELTVANLWDNRYQADMLAVSDVSSASWVLDEDTMSSNSATQVPTQQSVKAFVETHATIALSRVDIDGATDIGAALSDADLFAVDDGAGGTNRKTAASRIWDYIGSKIQGAPNKAVPVDADIIVIQDSANSNVITELTVGDLKTFVSSAAGVQNNYTSTTNPGTGDDSDDGYAEGSVWINTSTGTAYICTDDTVASAVWKSVTASAVGWDGDITDVDFSTGSDIGADLADGDQIIVADDSDSDSAKRSEMSRVRKYVHKAKTASYSSSQTLTSAECFGYTIFMTGAGTLTIPAREEGMNFTVKVIGAVAVNVDPNASDKIRLDGTELDDGDKVTCSTSGGVIVFQDYGADGFDATSDGNWTDGGA